MGLDETKLALRSRWQRPCLDCRVSKRNKLNQEMPNLDFRYRISSITATPNQSLRKAARMQRVILGAMLRLVCAAGPMWTTTHGTEFQPLIAGVSEGAEIVLPASVTATNLTVTAQDAAVNITRVVFELERQGAVIQRFTSVPPLIVTFTNLSAGKYFLTGSFQSSAGASASSDVSFDISLAVLKPVNDQWSGASLITAGGTTVTGSNVYATREPNEPIHTGTGGDRSIWWSWRATENSAVTVTTAGSSFDTVLAVYTGANLDELRSVGENDDIGTNSFSQATFNAVAGMTYYLAVDGALSATGVTESGSIQLLVIATAPPTITFASPTDGLSLLVSSPLTPTNVKVSATITDPAGIERVEYWLNGNQGITRTGTIPPPYHWELAGLACGDYVLTTMAANRLGLIAAGRVGFSVTSIAPEIFWDGSSPATASGFQLAVSGVKDVNYSLEGSTNLAAWSQLIRWTNFTGIQRVTDTNASRFKERFYRVQSP